MKPGFLKFNSLKRIPPINYQNQFKLWKETFPKQITDSKHSFAALAFQPAVNTSYQDEEFLLYFNINHCY